MSPQVFGVLMALGAGLCTTIGGACVFFLSSFRRLPLAFTMAVSAGVMAYVSFVEIFNESKNSMHQGLAAYWNTEVEDQTTIGYAYLFSTLCFFGGWWLATMMDRCLDVFLHKYGADKSPVDLPVSEEMVKQNTFDVSSSVEVLLSSNMVAEEQQQQQPQGRRDDSNQDIMASSSPEKKGFNELSPNRVEGSSVDGYSVNNEVRPNRQWWRDPFGQSNPLKRAVLDKISRNESQTWEVTHAEECFHRDSRKFLQMGVLTALALALHNIPEGIATFIGSVSSPKLGVSVAVAIGVHNIPEGFAVSVPLYFGTGKKWTSFMYSLITGLAEPVGALLAWAILGNDANPIALGVAFGVVCGIMTNIALRELLPAAYKYDPCNQVTTKSFLGGMAIIAFSLVLFQFQK